MSRTLTMYRSLTNRRFQAVLVVFLVLAFSGLAKPPSARAANGDLVQQTNFSAACGSGVGVGIAFDGKNLWYSCYASSPDLYKADPLTGAVLASYTVNGGLGALAWDGTRKKIWAGWGGGSGSSGDVRLLDPTTGSGGVVFNAASAAFEDLDDGLAYDAQDDTLLISPDTSTSIYHYSTAGASLGSFAWSGSGCYNSGLAIGGGLLFEGSDGCNHVWVVQRSTHAAAFDFATGAGGVRDEDLECDSVTFSPKTVMWSVEAYEPRRAVAFEIPPGSCATGGGVDSDGDGLLDEWETKGVTIDPDGAGGNPPQFIDLPKMGANPNKPDIYLQIDWMADGTHTHALTAGAIKKVVDGFAASPYVSPTGSVGINLHVDQGPASILNFATNATWGALSKATALTHVASLGTSGPSGYDWTAFQALKDANFTPTGRTPIFHYVVSAHNYPSNPAGSSGISRGIGASDLIISLGSFPSSVGTENQQAGTLMHELGHNLGLQHGGGDSVNYKPNYLSIMNYGFQLDGVIKGGAAGTFDYSRSTLGGLTESNLSEPAGIGAPGYGTRHWCPAAGSYVAVGDASGAIDWNCDGNSTQTGVSFDVNNDGAVGALAGYNDWSHLQLKGGAIGLAGSVPVLPTVTDNNEFMNPAEAAKVPPVSGYVFSGFFAPVQNPPAVNFVTAGSRVPVKFGLGGDRGLNVFAAGSPSSSTINCALGAASSADSSAASSAVRTGQVKPNVASSLKYNPATGRYTYSWKTATSWSGTCRRLTMTFNDGTTRYADFQFG